MYLISNNEQRFLIVVVKQQKDHFYHLLTDKTLNYDLICNQFFLIHFTFWHQLTQQHFQFNISPSDCPDFHLIHLHWTLLMAQDLAARFAVGLRYIWWFYCAAAFPPLQAVEHTRERRLLKSPSRKWRYKSIPLVFMLWGSLFRTGCLCALWTAFWLQESHSSIAVL